MKSRAFTLIELLVVVLIIGILAAIALPQYQLAVEKARATEAVINVQAWYQALQRYYLANDSYPDDGLGDIDISLPTPKHFTQRYYHEQGTVYIGYYNDDYMISRILTTGRELTCSVQDSSAFGEKICKMLCKTSTLQTVWGSGEQGCLIP